MKNMTINNAFPEGVIALMSHINAEKVATLFPDENAITDFDFSFQCDHGERKISHSLSCALLKPNGVDNLLSGVLAKYYNSWLREKEALEAEYDLLWTGGGDVKYTETRHETGSEENADTLQNSMNAFNGDEDSKTDKADRNGSGSHEISETIERSTERKENSATYAKGELVEKELNLRVKYHFYDIVSDDIARELCCGVY